MIPSELQGQADEILAAYEAQSNPPLEVLLSPGFVVQLGQHPFYRGDKAAAVRDHKLLYLALRKADSASQPAAWERELGRQLRPWLEACIAESYALDLNALIGHDTPRPFAWLMRYRPSVPLLAAQFEQGFWSPNHTMLQLMARSTDEKRDGVPILHHKNFDCLVRHPQCELNDHPIFGRSIYHTVAQWTEWGTVARQLSVPRIKSLLSLGYKLPSDLFKHADFAQAHAQALAASAAFDRAAALRRAGTPDPSCPFDVANLTRAGLLAIAPDCGVVSLLKPSLWRGFEDRWLALTAELHPSVIAPFARERAAIEASMQTGTACGGWTRFAKHESRQGRA